MQSVHCYNSSLTVNSQSLYSFTISANEKSDVVVKANAVWVCLTYLLIWS